MISTWNTIDRILPAAFHSPIQTMHQIQFWIRLMMRTLQAIGIYRTPIMVYRRWNKSKVSSLLGSILTVKLHDTHFMNETTRAVIENMETFVHFNILWNETLMKQIENSHFLLQKFVNKLYQYVILMMKIAISHKNKAFTLMLTQMFCYTNLSQFHKNNKLHEIVRSFGCTLISRLNV